MARCNRRRSPRYGRRTKVNLTHQQICRCLVHNGFGSVARILPDATRVLVGRTPPDATGLWWVAFCQMRPQNGARVRYA
jgi:hypothetical protein